MSKINKTIKRKNRNRKRLKKVNVDRYRISVFKSLKNISAQIIDDKNQATILSASSNEKDLKSIKKNKTDISVLVAEKLAKKAQEKNITKIYFDRGSYKYHGRIKAFADTLRENGMEF